MTKKCSCCLRKSQGEMTRIGRPMKNSFKDLIRDFELPDGKICKNCHEQLATFSIFKARISLRHEKQKKKEFQKARPTKVEIQQVTIKCEPNEVVPIAEKTTQSPSQIIKIEAEIHPEETESLINQESESTGTFPQEDQKYESDSDHAFDDWNFDDQLPPEQEVILPEQPKKVEKKPRPKKYAKRRIELLPRMSRSRSQIYECDLCGLGIKHKVQLKRHFVKIHELNKKEVLPCKFCTRKFYKRDKLIIHLNRLHRDQNEFHCGQCYSLFSTIELLREHRQIVHIKAQMGSRKQFFLDTKKGYSEKVLCPQCGTIITKSCLKAHISRVHLKEKKFGCTDCGKRFQTKTYLRYHIAYHHSNGAKPYQCDLCSQRYPTKHAIFKHIHLIHSDKKRVFTNKCEYCWKLFYAKQHLDRHMKRIHVPGEEDDGFRANPDTNMFHCMFCQKQFKGTMILKQHMGRFHR